MNNNFLISRRALAGGALLLGLGRKAALAQGFAGLGMSGQGFAPVTPGKTFSFPADHGPHPDFRIEWWYVTANLVDSAGAAYGAQWTLFRLASRPGAQQEGWPISKSGWAMRLSRARTSTATAKPLAGAGSARPALRQSRSGRGSIHGKCAALIRCATRPSRRSHSMSRARI